MFHSLGVLIICVGIGMFALGMLWLVVEAFREHVGWGIAVLFVPVATLAFLVLAWRRAKPAVVFQLYGILVVIGGAMLLPRPH